MMSRLTSGQRNLLPDSSFAGPGRSYPVNDRAHAANAKARAAEAAKAGRMSPAERSRIDTKANRMLAKKGTAPQAFHGVRARKPPAPGSAMHALNQVRAR
jgi:hypothetical protein